VRLNNLDPASDQGALDPASDQDALDPASDQDASQPITDHLEDFRNITQGMTDSMRLMASMHSRR
jgi:hypothetical protein